MIWEVFRQEEPGDYHKHCGNVHAPDAEMARMFAQVAHARRKPAKSLWVVPKAEIEEVDADALLDVPSVASFLRHEVLAGEATGTRHQGGPSHLGKFELVQLADQPALDRPPGQPAD